MSIKANQLRLKQKKLLFEYFVFLLIEWKDGINEKHVPAFTKLRLQKLLFLACTINATVGEKRLMSIFDRFSALPYGPVELDIYEAMNSNTFEHLEFSGNDCVIKDSLRLDAFDDLEGPNKGWVLDSVEELKKRRTDYLYMPVFGLVDITHQWTAWQAAITVAELLGSKSEAMSVEDICNSNVKAY